MTSKFQEIITLREQLNAKLKDFGQEAFTEGFAPFFAANPQVEGVTWTQYTPYFNDGDACEFSVHEPCLILNEQTARVINPDGDFDEYDADDFSGYGNPRRFESWDLRETTFNLEKIGFDAVWSQIPSEVFESVFGDHVEVRIMRDGTVTVEEYSHD